MGWNHEIIRGYSEKDIKKLIEKHEQEWLVDRYRYALSLFAEIVKNETKQRIIMTLDGRDTAGKGYTIKKITEYLDINIFDAEAFGVPTAEERKSWFQRYVAKFPQEEGIVFFDRSWYNRAIVEPVMEFCSQEEYDWFMENVNPFEASIKWEFWADLRKVYLSVDKETQRKRLKEREVIMKRWKSSRVDAAAQEKWWEYTFAKRRVLEITNTQENPWHVIDSTQRYLAVIEAVKLIINTDPRVAQFISDQLKIDLSPNKKVIRSWTQELEKMDEKGQFGKPFATIQTPQVIRV